jgi:hypothetical protein
MEYKSNSQKGNNNFNSQTTINNFPEEDMGIISEIIEGAIEKHKELLSDEELDDTKPELKAELIKKIHLNFSDGEDKEYVTKLFEDFFQEISIIESLITPLETFDQFILKKGVKKRYDSIFHKLPNALNSLEELEKNIALQVKKKTPNILIMQMHLYYSFLKIARLGRILKDDYTSKTPGFE